MTEAPEEKEKIHSSSLNHKEAITANPEPDIKNMSLLPDFSVSDESSINDCLTAEFALLSTCSLGEQQSRESNSSHKDLKRGQNNEGVSFTFNTTPGCSLSLPNIKPSDHHTVMFLPHLQPDVPPEPYPDTFQDIWDEDHVQMPCSSHNRLPEAEDSKWNKISESLRRKITTSKELEEAIMAYNSEFAEEWNFDTLHKFFSVCLSDDEREEFFNDTLPCMVDIALNLPKICTQPIPLLKKSSDHYLTISQKQIGCLLLNSFFCTFPGRFYVPRKSKNVASNKFPTYPDVNFNRLYLGRTHRQSSTMQKLKCLINYFTRIVTKEPTGSVTFHRQSIQWNDLPVWEESIKEIRFASFDSEGFIETGGQGLLQVDFANKLVGGGVLRTGCVQEEIRFVTCPELIVSRLFVEMLGLKEALIVTGVEQYNLHSGYSDTFKWEGDFHDETPRDSWGRRCTEIVAINATSFNIPVLQYKKEFIEKELNKAYSGFYQDCPAENLSSIATGNWGCGAFKGDPHLKFLIQLMAASQVNRDLLYFTFGSKTLRKDLQKMYSLLIERRVSVGGLYKMLISYGHEVSITGKEVTPKLYDFLNSFSHKELSRTQPYGTTTDVFEKDSNNIRLVEAVEIF